ncbi:unnamed protein product [Spirodela intermedia]|uniref:Uncharacterized protein n=1 Tax=Spirodela intermedia TaxID=51605 RepID=A0A7I8IZX7_SPIIN|nr:unnamed protein product [Spirodela intermedia]CAA6663525.1 unnamed protein product [Spirodela intermedia]
MGGREGAVNMHRNPSAEMRSSAVTASPVKGRRQGPGGAAGQSSSSPCCRHSSPSATLDLLIFILVLFSCTFLISSSFSYIFRSLSQILPSLLRPLADSFNGSPIPYAAGLVVFLAATFLVAAEIPCGGSGGGGGGGGEGGEGGGRISGRRSSWFRWWSNRCGNPQCKGLKKTLEFDVQLQTEESIKAAGSSPAVGVWREIDNLPWKGDGPTQWPAVLLFRARCGCPIAKLEAWGQKRGRRNKKWVIDLPVKL